MCLVISTVESCYKHKCRCFLIKKNCNEKKVQTDGQQFHKYQQNEQSPRVLNSNN